MNIKEIVDKIIKEADISASQYSVADRIVDVNQYYLGYVEKAVQIGSKSPISDGETFTEEFTSVAGSNTFDRTITDVPITRIDFQHDGATLFEKLPYDKDRAINNWKLGEMRFFSNEKQIFVEEAFAGTVRVTYARGGVTKFTTADYSLGTPPSPDFLPEVFHPLLWLRPAYRQAKFYKKDRAEALAEEIVELETLFDNHYGRESSIDSAFETAYSNGGNYR